MCLRHPDAEPGHSSVFVGNLFFDDVLCVCSIIVLTLQKGAEGVRTGSAAARCFGGCGRITFRYAHLCVASVEMDSLLYQIFAGKRLNLDRFAVPKEYYPIVSRYLD